MSGFRTNPLPCPSGYVRILQDTEYAIHDTGRNIGDTTHGRKQFLIRKLLSEVSDLDTEGT